MNTPFTRHSDANSLERRGAGDQKIPCPSSLSGGEDGGRGGTPREPLKGSILADENRCF